MRFAWLLVCVCIGFAQDVNFVPKWKKGDLVRLESLRTREDSRRPQANGTSRTPVEIEVLSADTSGWVVRWKNGETQLPAGMELPEALRKVTAKVVETPIELRLSPTGEFQSVVNVAQVKQAMGAILDTVLKEYVNDPKTQEFTKQLLNPEALLAAASSDAQTFFGMYGAELKPGEKVQVKMEQPFPLSAGLKLPCVLEVEFVGTDGKAAKLRTTTRFEPAGLKKAMDEVFTKAGVKPEDLGTMPQLQVLDEGQFEYDMATGWMRVVVADRRMEMTGSMARRDRKEFRLKP